MPKIYLYAEILTHIRQLTLYASLQTEKKEGTKIDLSSDKKVITIVHDGESHSIYLPTQISGTAEVTFPLEKSTEISVRLQIEDVETWKDDEAAGVEAPWAAPDLTSQTSISCRDCHAEVVSPNTIKEWKNLPSENWAELMELWYCHRPHVEDSQSHCHAGEPHSENKNLLANASVAVSTGVGMTDLTSIILDKNDCKNVKVTEGETKSISFLSCTNCSLELGSKKLSDDSIRLSKACIAVQAVEDADRLAYPAATFICAQLLSLIDATAVRKVVVYNEKHLLAEQASHHTSPPSSPTTTDLESIQPVQPSKSTDLSPSTSTSTPRPPALLLWIFNPDIYYSSSVMTSARSSQFSSSGKNTAASVRRAAKVFYKALTAEQCREHLGRASALADTGSDIALSKNPPTRSNQLEELPLLHTSDYLALHATLAQSTTLLPTAARKFQNGEWDVGLLDRYERNATGTDVMDQNPLSRKSDPGTFDGDGCGTVFEREMKLELPKGFEALYE